MWKSARTRAMLEGGSLANQPWHRWRVGDQAMLAGEPVTIAGFIDHGNPGPLDELRVEFTDGEEHTVQRNELTSVFDVIQGHWRTREVFLAGGRLNPSESLAVARHSADGFGWGDGAREPHSSLSRSCSGGPTARPRSRTTRRSNGT